MRNIKVDCIVKTNPFEIICTVTWLKTQSGLGAGEAGRPPSGVGGGNSSK